MLKFRTCICIKENRDFKINHRYKFMPVKEFMLVHFSDRVFYFKILSFNQYFIDLQEHRQKLLNQIL